MIFPIDCFEMPMNRKSNVLEISIHMLANDLLLRIKIKSTLVLSTYNSLSANLFMLP